MAAINSELFYICDTCDKKGHDLGDFDYCHQNKHKVTSYLNKQDADADKTHTEYALDILDNFQIRTLQDTDEILFYEDGVFKEYGEILIKKQCEKNIKECTNYLVREVTNTIRRKTYTKRDYFDKIPTRLNLKKSVLDLNTMIEEQHAYTIPSRIQIPTTYNIDCIPVRFNKFLESILPDSKDRLIILEAFACVLIHRLVNFEKIIMLIGDGHNGKSTLLKIMEIVLGHKNISHISIHDILYNRFAKSGLDGKMANIYADISSDEVLSKLGILKSLVSGDPVSVEKKNKNAFDLINTAKFFFSCNALPEIKEDSDAIFRRFIIAEFNEQFKGDKSNPNLLNELSTETEKSGILNLLIHHARNILDAGKLTYSDSTDIIRNEWKIKADPIASFVNLHVMKESNQRVTKSEMYKHYVEFCSFRKLVVKSEKSFSGSLKKMGYDETVARIHNKSTRVWSNVTISYDITDSNYCKTNDQNTISLADNETCNIIATGSKSHDETVKDRYKFFFCKTCDAGEFGINARGFNNELILDFHKGHDIEYS